MRNDVPADRSKRPLAVRQAKRRRFARAVPTLLEVLAGGPAWAFAMALSAWHALWMREHHATFHLQSILLLFALGGLIAWPLSLFTARYLAQDRAFETRLAAFLLFLIAGTVGVTAVLFFLNYRMFYAQWHAAAGSPTWFFQLLFTSLVALYQFLVLGVRLYLPLGAVALVLVSLWLARSDGRQRR